LENQLQNKETKGFSFYKDRVDSKPAFLLPFIFNARAFFSHELFITKINS